MSIVSQNSGTGIVNRSTGRRRLSRDYLYGLRRTDTGSLDKLLTTATAAKAQGQRWNRAYRTRVLIVDTFVIITVVTLAQIGRFRLLPTVDPNEHASWHVTALSAVLAISWLIALELQQSRDISLVGIGTEEYSRVVSATVWAFGLITVSGLLLEIQMSRGYLCIALVLGLAGLAIGRKCVRRDLARRRRRGECLTRVVVLGKPESVHVLSESFLRAAETGYHVVGVCIPDFRGEVGEELLTQSGVVPVLGDEGSVESALSLTSADAIAVAAVEYLGHERMKKLVWRLESMGTGLIVIPGVTDVAGTRLRMRPIDNLPLFHIAPPRKDGPSAIAKRAFDLAFATLAVIAALPVMLLAALAIKLDDGGPVIFRQERVGHRGARFRILKFRTMTVDAEARKDAERAAVGDTGVFYKSSTDSRITRIGRFLRATSIDELPQLFNVLGGAMSVVGPRPLVPGEGEAVEHFVERRAHVKPGITGLWQICGRSDVSAEERIRLDHSYVDNWSCVLDLVIVWRTIGAVLRRKGAC